MPDLPEEALKEFHVRLLRGALERAGTVEAPHPIEVGEQLFERWFEPSPGAPRVGGIFDRMAAEVGAFESFHEPPTTGQVLERLTALLRVHQQRERTARNDARSPEPRVPHLWIVCAERPQAVLDELAMVPLAKWPSGFHTLPVPIIPLHVVVVSELPKGRDTLMLRLLGIGEVLREALEELTRLPAGARELEAAARMVRMLYEQSEGVAELPDDDEEKAVLLAARRAYETIYAGKRRGGRTRRAKIRK